MLVSVSHLQKKLKQSEAQRSQTSTACQKKDRGLGARQGRPFPSQPSPEPVTARGVAFGHSEHSEQSERPEFKQVGCWNAPAVAVFRIKLCYAGVGASW